MNKTDDTLDKIVQGLEETYKKMVEFKKQKNSPLVVYKNGKIVELSPFEANPTTKYHHKSK
ncbi:hypothetical protein GCM10011339_33690 [Echinicola rosea]|uniref:Uncharacterized protein n=2 Tax=Echinicola rosea TaxID=1807691 RepID=A0ABQ1V8U4_9BACT|nr:hypothetical protein GCM10011339_33690 [Echinicola rosea]